MPKTQEDDPDRRRFLKLAGTAAPAALAAVTLSGTETEAAPLPVNETRLQDTEHTRAYFDAARF